MSPRTRRCLPGLGLESQGLLVLLLSSVLFSIMGYFVQRTTILSGIPSTELVCIRAAFQGFLTVPVMSRIPASTEAQGGPAYQSGKGRPLILSPFGGTPEVRRVVVARGAVGGFGFVMFYYTLSALPLGDATALLSLKSVLTVLGGGMFLGETIRASHAGAAVASAAGAFLIA